MVVLEASMVKVAFKSPGGRRAFAFAPGLADFARVDIDEWISTAFRTQQWTGWYCYSDHPPPRPGFRAPRPPDGQCKGIVLWNAMASAWLVHSVPDWPAAMPLESVPETHLARAHCFAFWSGDADRLGKIESQVDLMGAKVYLGKRSVLCGVPRVATLQRVILDDTTDHLAKNKLWDRDLYECMGSCRVQSWMRPVLDDTPVVQNISRMQFTSRDSGEWTTDDDQGTWAIGDTWMAIGDVNRAITNRGGGVLMIRDAALVRAMHNISIS